MRSISKYNYAKSSAQKLRLVINLIRGKEINTALNILNHINKKASIIIKKTLISAISNAKNNKYIHNLYIQTIYVNKAKTYKRIFPRAKGRTDYIKKKTSHIVIILSNYIKKGQYGSKS